MNRVYYCTPTYKSYDLCLKSIEAVRRGTRVPDHIFVMDNTEGAGTQLLLDTLKPDADNSGVTIMSAGYNLGVAKSWNAFHQYIDRDYIIIANDDIEVHAQTLEKLVEAADKHPDQICFAGQSTTGDNAFSLFLLKTWGYKEIGPFDENFLKAYFEDNDYFKRMTIAGYTIVSVPEATYDHVGSSTLKRYSKAEEEQHHEQFRSNRAYYVRKWGGDPHHEKFMSPFDVRCFFCDKPANHRRDFLLCEPFQEFKNEPLCDEHVREDHDVWNEYSV